jgi:hypothetical protein
MFKVLYRVTAHLWHEDHYPTENEARAAANHAFTHGAYQVELYRKTRYGYDLVKKARQTMKQAAETAGRTMADEIIADGFEM